jgi:hypothetical protein
MVILALVLVSCAPAFISTPTETPPITDIPADIPIYSDHSHVLVLSDNDPYSSYSYRAYADLETVSQFYQTEMVNQGWEQTQESISYGTTAIILHYKKDSRKAIIDMEYSNDFTGIGISVGP